MAKNEVHGQHTPTMTWGRNQNDEEPGMREGSEGLGCGSGHSQNWWCQGGD